MSDEKIKNELKALIIESLDLEDISPEDINDKDPLFNEGLGLDSIDALEIGVALQKNYGIKLDPEQDDVNKYFANIESLADLIETRVKEG